MATGGGSQSYKMEFTQTIARLLDYPLGWTLALPREGAIAIVALLTSLLLTLVRKFTTNQDRMRRCKLDLARLKVLLREHKRAGDKAAVARTRATSTTVRMIQMRAEGLGLLVSLVPIAALALWAVERLDYLPLRSGEEVTITAHFSPTAIDSVTHLVPAEDFELKSSAVQIVAADPDDAGRGSATWKIAPIPSGETGEAQIARGTRSVLATLALTIRHERQSARHVLRVGDNFYEPPVIWQQGGAIVSTQTDLAQARFLGLVPGIPAIGLAPWLVAYLLIAIPLTPLVRYVLRVY